MLNAYSTIRGGEENQKQVNGVWVPARPEQAQTILERLIDCFLVLVGKADAIRWDGQ